VLVHLTGGRTEMHFHFFVVLALIALYQTGGRCCWRWATWWSTTAR
jgi:hypothetical protein